MTEKRKISFEQDQALARGRQTARANQRRAVADRQAREAAAAADQSRVELTPPRNPDRLMPVTSVRVFGGQGELRSSREFYDADEAWQFARLQFTKRGVLVFNWDTEEFEAEAS